MKTYILLSLLFITISMRSMEEEENPFIQSIYEGDITTITAQINAGADVNQIVDQDDQSALCLATAVKDEQLALLLIERGALVNHDDRFGFTPLINVANGDGSPAVTAALINAGASVNCEDMYGNTPLIRAVYNGNDKCVEILLNRGALVNYVNKLGFTALKYVTQTRMILEGETGWESASRNIKRYRCCELLIERMLKIPTDAQRERIYTFMMCIKRIGFDMVIRSKIKSLLPKILHDENKEHPEKSIVYPEINAIDNGLIKRGLFDRFLKQEATLEHATQKRRNLE